MHAPQATLPAPVPDGASPASWAPSWLLTAGSIPVAAYDPDIFELEPTPAPPPGHRRAGLHSSGSLRGHRRRPPPPSRPIPSRTDTTYRGRSATTTCPTPSASRSSASTVAGRSARTTASSHSSSGPGRMPTSTSTPPIPDPTTPGSGPSARPGPSPVSRHDDDSHECAYLYGWNAAADGYAACSPPMSRSTGPMPMPIASRATERGGSTSRPRTAGAVITA